MNAAKLAHHFPGAQWNWPSDSNFATLEWFGPGDPPTEAELAALPWPIVTTDRVNAERDARIAAGFLFNGTIFQARLEDQKRIAGAATLAVAAVMNGVQPGDLRWHGGIEDFQWIAADNTTVTMDAQTVIAFGQKAANWESVHVFAARAIKQSDPIPADFEADAYWPPREAV